MPRAAKIKISQVRTDKELELHEWMAMNHRTLVLKCDQYSLNPKGKKEVLAKRLLTHVRPETANDAGNVTTVTTNIGSSTTTTTTTNVDTATGESTGNKENIPAGMEIVDASLLTEAIVRLQEQQSRQQENTESLKMLIQSALPLAAVSPPAATTSPASGNPTLLSPPLPTVQQNLTSYIPAVNNNPPPNTSSTVNNFPPANNQPIHFQVNPTNPDPLSLVNNLAPVHGFDGQQHLLTGNNTSPLDAASNPYIPPALTSALMAKIKKKLDYVANIGAYTRGEDGEEFCLSQVQSAGSQLTFKKRSTRAPLSNLSHWVHAWNIFYEATLHYHPSMHFQVFAYFKHIIQFATNHKFSFHMACDQTHRRQIAAQRHLPTSSQSASWITHNTVLFNTYLRDNMKAQCSKCLGYDHFAKQCPKATPLVSNIINQQPTYQQLSSTQQHWQAAAPPRPVTPQPPVNQQAGQFRNASQNNTSRSPNLINVGRNQDRNTCYRFNKGQFCRQPCNFPHVCNVCGRSDHIGLHCNNTTTTGFRP